MILTTRDLEIRHFHLFCGLGGGARGFNRGRADVGTARATFRCVGGIDVDKAAIEDFSRAANVRGTVLDLFSYEQYVAFHGKEPPAGWREATPDDIRAAAHHEIPHIGFGSAPCKGFSGLLSESRSSSAKYQALNQLALRGLWLALEAWKDDPLPFWLWENVPRIQTRGRAVLDQMIGLLEAYGYVARETTHDCGELGNLGQSRKRFLLVARHPEKVPPFLYEPVKRPLRAVGDVLEAFPLPSDPAAGPMHRMRALQWKTWLRLAFVEAGSDWRSLNKLRVVDGMLADYGIAPEREYHNGMLGVTPWDQPSATITSTARPHNGQFAVADPRANASTHSQLGVNEWRKPSRTITGEALPTNGTFAVADPRPGYTGEYQQLGVNNWDKPIGTVSGQSAPGGGAYSVADPRPNWNDQYGSLGVNPWDEPTGTIIGVRAPGQGCYSIADPRVGQSGPRFSSCFRIVAWNDAAPAVVGHGGAGGQAVADPRTALVKDAGDHYRSARHYGVLPWDRPSQAVTASADHDNGAFSVADPRCNWSPNAHRNKLRVVDWEKPTGTVIGGNRVDSGALSVADPRCAVAEALPGASDRLIAVIRALDGTWHRPFTTLELAALQGLVDPDEFLELHGSSDTAWRERIGNAVPSPAAEAIASVMGTTLLLAWAGETFHLSATPIWVQPIAIALSVKSDSIS